MVRFTVLIQFQNGNNRVFYLLEIRFYEWILNAFCIDLKCLNLVSARKNFSRAQCSQVK
jgi:hypothetical protein